MGEIAVEAGDSFDQEELRELYASVGWTAYTRDPEALLSAVMNSTFTVSARATGELVGLARIMSDDVAIAYLQDVLVRPDFQHRGVGTAMLEICLKRFDHVRQKVLLTDEEKSQHAFYRSLGFTDVEDLEVRLHTFVCIAGLNA